MSRVTIKQEPESNDHKMSTPSRPMYGFQLWDPREGTVDGNVYPATGSLTLDNSTPWKLYNTVTSESNSDTDSSISDTSDQYGNLQTAYISQLAL